MTGRSSIQQSTRVEITIHGKVQRVGYRYIIQEIARELGVKGYVQNMPDGTVKVVAEAPKRVIQKFIQMLKVKEPPVDVGCIQARYSKPTGELEFFMVKYGELAEEMAEGFGTGLKYMDRTRAETQQGFQTLTGKVDTGFQTLTGKVDTGFQTLTGKVDTGFQTLTGKVDKGFQTLTGKVDRRFQTLTGRVDKGFKKLRGETKEGFQALGSEVRGMREDVKRNFQEMSTRYDAISGMLGEAVKTIQEDSLKTRKELVRAVDTLSRLVKEFVKERRTGFRVK
jgi:acylphosphatase